MPYNFNVRACSNSWLHVALFQVADVPHRTALTCDKFWCYDVLNVHAVSFITSLTATASRTSITPLRPLVFHFDCNGCHVAITNCLHSNRFVPFTFVTHLYVAIPWAHFVTANALVVVSTAYVVVNTRRKTCCLERINVGN